MPLNTRRDLLKLFGAGAIISPIAASGVLDVRAKVIEAPKVELVPASEFTIDPIPAAGTFSAHVTVERDGKEIVRVPVDYIHRSFEHIETTSISSAFRTYGIGNEWLDFRCVARESLHSLEEVKKYWWLSVQGSYADRLPQ